MNHDYTAMADELQAELDEADEIAIWRTRQAWAEFEDAWREDRQGRRHTPSAKQRSTYAPLPDSHPLAQRKPWTAEQLDRAAWRISHPYNQRAVWPDKQYPEVGL